MITVPAPGNIRRALRGVHGIGVQAFLPSTMAIGAVVALALGLLLADRGREPGIVRHGAAAPLDSLAGAANAAAGLSITWAGLLVVSISVGWTLGYNLEHGVESTVRAAGARPLDRLLASYLFTLLMGAAATAVLAISIAGAGAVLDGWAAPERATDLGVGSDTLLRLFIGVTFWWASAALAAIVTRSSVMTFGVLAGLTLTGLLLTRQDALSPLLPVRWLGEMAGFDRGSSTLTDIWANGHGLVGSWQSSGSGLHTTALASVVLVVLVAWGSTRQRA